MKSRLLSKTYWFGIGVILYALLGLFGDGNGVDLTPEFIAGRAQEFSDLIFGIVILVLREVTDKPLKPVVEPE